MRKKLLLSIIAGLLFQWGYNQNPVDSSQNENILLFTKTAGFRHSSIETGVKLVKMLGEQNGFNVTHTEDASVFNDSFLKNIDLIVFLSTTGDILNPKQELAFKNFIQNKKGFLGIHAATDTEFEWEWYGKLVGGYFSDHPRVQEARLEVLDKDHPSCKHLPDTWIRKDEWYNFKNLNSDVRVLINLDESSYEGGKNGENHPIAWSHVYEGSRIFYTGGGHTHESYDEPLFVKHILGGILWCLNRENAIE